MHARFLVPLVAAAILSTTSLLASDKDLESAVRAALNEVETAKAEILVHDYHLFGHRFAVPPLTFEKKPGEFVITGKLTHFNADQSKDQINYRVIKAKGGIKEIALQINGGEFRPVSEAILTALGGHRTGAPMTEEQQAAVKVELRKAVDQSWQRAAEFLVAHIGIRHC